MLQAWVEEDQAGAVFKQLITNYLDVFINLVLGLLKIPVSGIHIK